MRDITTENRPKQLTLPDYFFEGLSELLLEIGIDGYDFINEFTRHYVLCAAKNTKKKTDIYNATGFSEYTAKKYLNDADHKTYPKRKQYYRSLINRIKELCERSKDGCIPIYGAHRSYISAYDDTNSATNVTTAASMLNKLIKAGFVEKIDEKNIRFVTSLQTKGFNNQEDFIRVLSDLVSRASSTLLHNLLAKNSDDTLFQMTYFSNAVHPDNHQELSNWLREEQRNDFRKYQKKIDSFEEKEFIRKWVQSLNQEIGVTSLIFNTQSRKNHEDT